MGPVSSRRSNARTVAANAVSSQAIPGWGNSRRHRAAREHLWRDCGERSLLGLQPSAPNAKWLVSVNHDSGPAAFREPQPQCDYDFSSRSRFRATVSSVNSG